MTTAEGGPTPEPLTACLLCGAPDVTVEHIIPQTLWKRFGINPDREDLAVFRTILCSRHNQATAVLHERAEMMQLIESGEPLARRTLTHLGDWAVWVTLLLGLARGSGILGREMSLERLRLRFDNISTGVPRGVRVYAARVTANADPSVPPVTPHTLALRGDSRVMLNSRKEPCGFAIKEGPIGASESIRVGKIAMLVVGPTYHSGPDHLVRLDRAAGTVGLELIHPLPRVLPSLTPIAISMKDLSRLFTVLPFGADLSLMPPSIAPGVLGPAAPSS